MRSWSVLVSKAGCVITWSSEAFWTTKATWQWKELKMMPSWPEADCQWLEVLLGSLSYVLFSCPSLIFLSISSPCALLIVFLHTLSPLFLCQISTSSPFSFACMSICTALWGSFSFQLLSVSLTFFSLVFLLSLNAAAWCSVNRDWAWRYSTTHQDSWTLPTSSLTPFHP